MLVYYYYQFVYKLVYYNNKTDNASVPLQYLAEYFAKT